MNQARATCIYCGKEFDPGNTKPEHIVLAALGGKRKSRRIVCSTCNQALGSEIDRPFAEFLKFARAMPVSSHAHLARDSSPPFMLILYETTLTLDNNDNLW